MHYTNVLTKIEVPTCVCVCVVFRDCGCKFNEINVRSGLRTNGTLGRRSGSTSQDVS